MAFSKTSPDKDHGIDSTIEHKLHNASPAARLPPELLEQILLDLDIRTIFKVQRVAVEWRNVIEGTPSIQRKLLLSPDAEQETEKWLRWIPLPRSPGSAPTDHPAPVIFPVVTFKAPQTAPQQLVVDINPLT